MVQAAFACHLANWTDFHICLEKEWRQKPLSIKAAGINQLQEITTLICDTVLMEHKLINIKTCITLV